MTAPRIGSTRFRWATASSAKGGVMLGMINLSPQDNHPVRTLKPSRLAASARRRSNVTKSSAGRVLQLTNGGARGQVTDSAISTSVKHSSLRSLILFGAIFFMMEASFSVLVLSPLAQAQNLPKDSRSTPDANL